MRVMGTNASEMDVETGFLIDKALAFGPSALERSRRCESYGPCSRVSPWPAAF